LLQIDGFNQDSSTYQGSSFAIKYLINETNKPSSEEIKD